MNRYTEQGRSMIRDIDECLDVMEVYRRKIAQQEKVIADRVKWLRAGGCTWVDIGWVLRMSRQAAQKRFPGL